MDHRQRVEKCLSHQEPDRVPIDYWVAKEVDARLLQDLGCKNKEEVLRHFDVDFRYLQGPSYAGQKMAEYDDGTTEDLWGVRRRVMNIERERAGHHYKWSYKHVAISPLEHMETVAEIEKYDKWPSADNWDYSGFEAQCDEHRGEYVVINMGDRLDRTAQFKPMMYIRGMEQAYIDLGVNPEIAECIIEHIKTYFLEYNERVFKAAKGKIDIFMMGDDFGTQQNSMMSVDMWRHFFKPGFKAYIELAHKYGMKVMHHTCGSVVELIPEFIDCGLDILQSLQPLAEGMDLGKLKQKYGKDICFQGGMDIQHTLPNGSPDDVREMVRSQFEKGKPGGGYITCTAHNIQPDTPTENIKALFEAYQEYGKY
jgi:uroporphyrinogen decarboxylase